VLHSSEDICIEVEGKEVNIPGAMHELDTEDDPTRYSIQRETRDGLRTAVGYLDERKNIEKCLRTWRLAQGCVRRSDLRYNIGK